MKPLQHHVWIGLGANLEEPVEYIRAAIENLAQHPDCCLLTQSSLYRTTPIDCDPGQPDYINAVVELTTSLTPDDLLEQLFAIEQNAGRTRAYRNAPRTLDLDLLLYDDQILRKPDLQLPHPRMHERAFVLAPLAEIAPNLSVPGHGLVVDLLNQLSHQSVTRMVP